MIGSLDGMVLEECCECRLMVITTFITIKIAQTWDP